MLRVTKILVRAVKQPAIWILVAFLGLVAAEVYFWVSDRHALPHSFTGSLLYPVLLGGLAYVFVFKGTDHYRNFQALLTASCFGTGFVTLFLLSKRPKLFDALSAEDGMVENLSAAALFVASAAFLVFMVRQILRREWLTAVIAAGFAAVLFVIGMEEISWMQRILDFETGDFFLERNIQNESNLHNLNTGATEKAFYFGGFVALIVMPYFQRPLTEFLHSLRQHELATMLPAQWLLVPSSVMVGYVGTSVVEDPTAGIAAMVTALMLFRFALDAVESGNLTKFLIYGAFLALLVLAVYYYTTYNYSLVEIRSWARKEYLELIVALGLMGYAVSVLHQSFEFEETRDAAGR